MFGKSAWGGICLSFKRPTLLDNLVFADLWWFNLTSPLGCVHRCNRGRSWPHSAAVLTWIMDMDGECLCLSCRTRHWCHVITFLRSGQVIRQTVNKNFEKPETRSSLQSDSFPQCSSLRALFIAQEIKKCIFGASVIFHERTVVAGPCTALNHLTVVITGSGKKGNISKRTGRRPSNTCVCDGIAGSCSDSPGLCRWERSQHLNFTLKLSFFILQHFLTTPITFHVHLGQQHDSSEERLIESVWHSPHLHHSIIPILIISVRFLLFLKVCRFDTETHSWCSFFVRAYALQTCFITCDQCFWCAENS